MFELILAIAIGIVIGSAVWGAICYWITNSKWFKKWSIKQTTAMLEELTDEELL